MEKPKIKVQRNQKAPVRKKSIEEPKSQEVVKKNNRSHGDLILCYMSDGAFIPIKEAPGDLTIVADMKAWVVEHPLAVDMKTWRKYNALMPVTDDTVYIIRKHWSGKIHSKTVYSLSE